MNKITFFLMLLSSFACLSQDITIKGRVNDTIGTPLNGANVIAVSKTVEGIRFGITDDLGRYKLNLHKDANYLVTVSYLGFVKQEIKLQALKDSIINFNLKESREQLEEVIINQPVIVKQDTIIFNADSFTNGKERKLKEILEKLPNVEVDKKGNVKVNGNRVTKFLVEGEKFFSGDTKLGVNNIPADAVDKIEVLDKYSSIKMLKKFDLSDELAMNIKLKEDKKKFVFGDITGGSGDNQNYILNPALFYYSPETKVNFIGDLNNIGEKSFTLSDYLNFENADLLDFENLNTINISQFLNINNSKETINKFGGLNLSQKLNKKLKLRTFVIASNIKNIRQATEFNQYSINGANFTENRFNDGETNNTLLMGKLNLTYVKNKKFEFETNTNVSTKNNKSFNYINTVSNNTNIIDSRYKLNELSIKQNFQVNKEYNDKNTLQVKANYSFNRNKPFQNWLTNEPILTSLLTLTPQSFYNINQIKKSNNNQLDFKATHFLILNSKNHLYTSVSNSYYNNQYNTSASQLLDNQTVNSFNQFENNQKYTYNNSSIGINYKLKLGKTTVNAGLYYNNFIWNPNTNNFNNKNKSYLLPKFKTVVDFSVSEKLKFNYDLKPTFATYNQLTTNYILNAFNTATIGNANLENTLTHNANINYNKFNMYRGLTLFANVNFRYSDKNIQNVFNPNGVNQEGSFLQLYSPQKEMRMFLSASKRFKHFKIGLSTRNLIAENNELINNVIFKSKIRNFNLAGKIETKYNKKYPKVILEQTQYYTNYKTRAITNKTITRKTNISTEYEFLKDFIFESNYEYSHYQNKERTVTNNNSVLNGSLLYHKENSPYTIELKATNILNVKINNFNSTSPFLISDTFIYVLPRILLVKFTYKL